MQNVQGIPRNGNNLKKTDHFEWTIRKEKPDIMTIIETGVYEGCNTNMPLEFQN